ncbi:MAG: LysM peptidoglycan-binding domain-containing protein [Gammaproteobacteria bacterium]
MKILPSLKIIGIAVLTLGMAVGCATQQQQPQKPQATEMNAKAKAAEQAIADAKASLAKAKALDYEWRDSDKILKQAEQAYKDGKYDEAIKLANKAKEQGDLAVQQYYKEKSMNRGLQAAPKATTSYTVMRGDSLWRIAGKSEIYNNPYEWPLIYKANSDKIHDADLIYPGQNFTIDTNPSAADVDAAVRHAKTRGAWSLGVVEESDKAYLAGQ